MTAHARHLRRATPRGRLAVGGAALLLAAVLSAASVAPASSVAGAGATSTEPGSPTASEAARLAKAGPAPNLRAPRAEPGTKVRKVTLVWKGAPKPSRYTKSFGIPGIGTMTFTCRPNETRISLKANNRDAETQMWLAKYEDKSYGRAVAVKTVRIYRYQHWYDPGTGGTGNPQHEGLNQRGGKNGVENYGKGYAHGIISQRPSRNREVGDAAAKPVTSFDFNWYWNGFDHPPKYRYCKFQGVFVTQMDRRIGVNWHSEQDVPGNQFQQIRVPSLGYLQLRCEPGRFGNRTVALVPDDPNTTAYVEIIEGEGRVDQHVEIKRRERDPETGKIGPLALPTNGMMRFYFDKGRSSVPFILSSYIKANDPNPRQNLCETAMGLFPR